MTAGRRLICKTLGSTGIALLAVVCGGCEDNAASDVVPQPAPSVIQAPMPENLEHYSPDVADQFRTTATAVDNSPHRAERWRELGMVYQAHYEYGHAATSYEQALDLNPTDARTWYYLAVVLHQLGRYDEADHAMQEAINLAPNFAPAHWRLALWHLNQGAHEQAMAAVEQSLKLEPNNRIAPIIRARVLLQSGRSVEATEALQQLILERPDDPYLHFLLGTAYRQTGELDQAQAHLERGDGKEPAWTDWWLHEMSTRQRGFFTEFTQASRLINVGRAQEAVTRLESLSARHPDEMMIHLTLIRAHRVTGNSRAALDTLDRAEQTDPTDSRIWVQRAGVLRDLALAMPAPQQSETLLAALASADHALQLSPHFALGYTLRADILLLLGRTEEAISGHLQAQAINPGNATIAFRLGASLYASDRWAEAIEPLETAHRLDQSNSHIALLLAAALIKSSRSDDALRIVIDSARRFPGEPRFEQLRMQIEAAQAEKDD